MDRLELGVSWCEENVLTDQSVLNFLESEARFVLDRVFQNFSKIGLLFSGGKDSTVLHALAEMSAKTFGKSYDLIHIDTGMNFSEVINFRDQIFNESGRTCVIEKVVNDAKIGLNRSQSHSLKKVLKEKGYDILLGGGRRDEDKARQKEVFFSKRSNRDSSWRPEDESAEIWPWIGLGSETGFHYRTFPLNNWLEKDVLSYVHFKKIELCSLYYSHRRSVIELADGSLKLASFGEYEGEGIETRVRFRTIGDMTNSRPIRSEAQILPEIISENHRLKTRERASREDDSFSEYSMEVRKREGYF